MKKLYFPIFALALSLLISICFASEVAITMDDFDVQESTLLPPAERNDRILLTLADQNIKADLFVACKFIQTKEAKKLLQKWNDFGHTIGNHTFTHPYFGKNITVADFLSKEITRCENQLKPYQQFQKIFRFPMLAEGNTTEKRDQLRQWFKNNGYSIGHVTIDASDWYIDQRMREKYNSDPKFNLLKYRDYYMAHIWDRAQYYNELSKKVLGHEVKNTLLIHFNLLNALYLNDLINMFKQKGWKVINANAAFKDTVFQSEPNSMPSGQSLIWALAKESGKFESELRYPGEDESYEKPKMDALGL